MAWLVKPICFWQVLQLSFSLATAEGCRIEMNEAPERVLAVFTEVLPLPAAERSGFLDRACAGNDDLRQRVEGLLRSLERAGDFLGEAAVRMPMGTGHEITAGEKPGDVIGPYKLLQEIGEGGCGVVFMAEQEAPVRRRVAVKVVKPGMDSKNVIARFEAERQALALMDHPNIAHVFDAGATASGRPYFVMELIRGIKITDYCDENLLTTIQRLELFTEVCNAVQHAHQKGIIHRDIKPSNILVTTSGEGKPLPKVIDFGIAKATTGQRLTDNTVFTAFEMLIGTPAYMSPEQASLTSVDVDTRSDIYSLGVLLYELLTGTTPFDTRELLKAGLDEVRREIREREPIRPSTRLSTMMAPDLTIVSQHHRAEPPKLIREVRGDLDWIVMKALEKEPARRYATANGFAVDVQRFLGGEVVMARPPSSLYKFRKLFLRNKLLMSGLGIFFVLLVVLLGFTCVLLMREKELRQQSDLLAADSLAEVYVRDSKPELAESMFLRGLEIRRKLTPDYVPTPPSLQNLIWAQLSQRKFDQAEAQLDRFLTPSNVTKKEYVDLVALRAEVLARSGRWAKAQADAERVRAFRPEDFASYHRLATLMVANKDIEGYRHLCQQIVDRFKLTDQPFAADQMAKDCLILPASGVDLGPVGAMAELAVTKGQLSPAYTFFQCCKALAEYRQGHFDGAVKWARIVSANPYPYSQAEAYAILSMGQYQLNQVDDARAQLANCEKVIQTQLPASGSRDLGTDWRDWIIGHALFTEAQNLLSEPRSGDKVTNPVKK